MIGDGLSPAARALLDAARGGLAPDAATVARMKANIASAAGATASTAIAIKLGLVAFVATLAAGAAIYGNRARSVTPPRIEIPAAQVGAAAPVAQSRADSPTSDPATKTADETAIEMAPETMTRPNATSHVAVPLTAVAERATRGASPAPTATAERATRGGSAPPTATTASTAAGAHASRAVSLSPTGPKRRADLAREVELVDLAMTALRRGDTTSALAAIRMHGAETRGAGQLAEDAAAIEIEALCRNHDASVATKLGVFDVRFPRSAQRSRLSATCP